jgi:hypothetical protein
MNSIVYEANTSNITIYRDIIFVCFLNIHHSYGSYWMLINNSVLPLS